MKSIKIFCRLFAIAFLLLPAVARAEDYYVTISTGNTEIDSDKFTEASKIAAEFNDSDTGLSIAFGKNLNDGFSVEGFYTDLGQIELIHAKAGDNYVNVLGETTDLIHVADYTETISASTIGIAGKKAFNISESLDGFFKVGYHSWNSEANEVMSSMSATESKRRLRKTSNDGTDIFWGLGADYNINEKIALSLGYDNYKVGEDAATFLHIGVKFGF